LKLLNFKPWRILAIGLTLICIIVLESNIALGDSAGKLIVIGMYLGLLMWVFSRNKFEDELTMQYRMNSMCLAVLLNYALLLVANFTLYGMAFLTVMVYNMVSIPVFFVVIFSYYSLKNSCLPAQQVKGGLLL
jgi:hypothetical protein